MYEQLSRYKVAEGNKSQSRQCFELNEVMRTVDPISGVCRSPALWMTAGNTSMPLVYFHKPKWISEESFLEVISSIQLELPVGYLIYRMADKETKEEE